MNKKQHQTISEVNKLIATQFAKKKKRQEN